MEFYSVITTIAEPTESVGTLTEFLREINAELIAVGDKKGPAKFDVPGAVFLSLKKQLELPFSLAAVLPTGHYTRKNLGYLYAMSRGAECIYETDDDNAPLAHWHRRQCSLANVREVAGTGWTNVYRYFSDKKIWPRGLPLDEINTIIPVKAEKAVSVHAPIQQGLVNLSPDVDAIWRLVMDAPFDFQNEPSVVLLPGVWCPFNTQSTWWFKEAFRLMYIPSLCSFRMCDIWKSFIAQRCLWELGYGVAFHAPEVVQKRNAHNLLKDFSDEVPGYNGNRKLADTLANLELRAGGDYVGENMLSCYEALVREHFFPAEELDLLRCWLRDCDDILQ